METLSRGRGFLNNPVVLLFGSQFLAALPVYFILVSISDTAPAWPVVAAFQGVAAAIIGRLLGLSKWWVGAQVALPFAALYSIGLQAPAWIWLAFFALLLLIYWNSARDGVPLYLSNAATWSALARLLPETQGVRVADVGGGIGGTGLYLARYRPDASIVSIESAPLPALVSKLRARFAGLANLDMRTGDFWNRNLAEYQVVYAFLSPAPMERLYKKVRAEMKPGGLFISNSFTVPGVEADETVELNDGRRTRLHIWRL